MNYKVVYFTRTGNSKRIAEKLAEKLACDKNEITDSINWGGFFGFMKGGYYSTFNKEVEIKISGSIDDADELILVAPLWAGKLAPSAKALLKKFPANKINLVVTSGGSSSKETDDYKSVNDICENKKNEDEIINYLIKQLQA